MNGHTDNRDRPVLAVTLAVLGGIWIAVAGSAMTWGYHMGANWSPADDMMQHRGRTIGAWTWHHHMMDGYGPGFVWPWLGLACGVVAIVGAAASC